MKRFCLFISLLLLLGAAGCTSSAEAAVFAMDTYCTIEAYGAHASDAVDAAVEELVRLDRLLSITGTQSDIALFNASEQSAVAVSAETASLVAYAIAVSEMTDGAFDITIEPVMELWGFYDEAQKVPDSEAIANALKLVDAAKLTVEETYVKGLPDQKIDLGGIAKGYASNRIAELLRDCGIQSAVISLGGNVQTIGSKPDGSAWRIGVRDPSDESSVACVVEITDRAVVTAGSYQRYFEADGIRYHHIIDPNNGYPANSGLLSVTVISEDGAYADALSTALFVMGKDRAVDFWRANPGFDMLLVDDENHIFITDGVAFYELNDRYKLSNIVA